MQYYFLELNCHSKSIPKTKKIYLHTGTQATQDFLQLRILRQENFFFFLSVPNLRVITVSSIQISDKTETPCGQI